MKIKVFGKAGCTRTKGALLKAARLVKQRIWRGEVELEFFDLGTAEGLAEAAYCQLEGEIPAVLVETDLPGPVISGESPSRKRTNSSAQEGRIPVMMPSLN